MTGRTIAGLIILSLLLAFALGVTITQDKGDPTIPIRVQIAQLELETKRQLAELEIEKQLQLQPLEFAFRVAIVIIVSITLASLGFQLVRYASNRAGMVWPSADGVFPLIKVKVGRDQIVYDPNRAVTPSVIFSADEVGTVSVLHIASSAHPSDQRQISSQAQVVQGIIAAARHAGDRQSSQLVKTALQALPPPEPTLPEVTVLDIEPSHVERLLAEEGIGE